MLSLGRSADAFTRSGSDNLLCNLTINKKLSITQLYWTFPVKFVVMTHLDNIFSESCSWTGEGCNGCPISPALSFGLECTKLMTWLYACLCIPLTLLHVFHALPDSRSRFRCREPCRVFYSQMKLMPALDRANGIYCYRQDSMIPLLFSLLRYRTVLQVHFSTQSVDEKTHQLWKWKELQTWTKGMEERYGWKRSEENKKT